MNYPVLDLLFIYLFIYLFLSIYLSFFINLSIFFYLFISIFTYRYAKQASRFSSMWQLEGDLALKTALLWVERVHKYGSLKHLSLAAQQLNIAQFLILDVILFISIVFILPFIIFFLLCHRSPSKHKLKNKKE